MNNSDVFKAKKDMKKSNNMKRN